jgi:hypothetical protein
VISSFLPLDPDLVRSNFPAELQGRQQWVLWRLEKGEKRDKSTKVPRTTRGGHAKSTDPKTWSTLEKALGAHLSAGVGGVGFVFAGEGIVGIDLDHCRDPETGAIDPWARTLLDVFSSYTEMSPSGTGVHIIVRGTLAGAGRKKHVRSEGAHPEAAIEIYDRARYFTVTGRRLPEYPAGIEERQEAVEHLYTSMDKEEGKPSDAATPAHADAAGALGDDEVLRRAMAARNGAAFSRLWEGDTSGHGGDDSAADLALCSHLAFWSRGDAAQMDRLFRRSGLYREKWERENYRNPTITKALEGRTVFYEPRRPAASTDRQIGSAPVPEPWQPPVPFDSTADLPRFPTGVFPVSVAAWVRAEATSTQTPEDLAGMISLAVLATSVAKKVRAKIRPEWTEPLCVYTEVTLAPGERKSAVFRDAIAPLLDWERDAILREGPRLREATLTLEMAEGRLKEAKTRAIKARGADRKAAEADLHRLSEDMARLPRPVLPRVLADDVTPERLFGLLTEQGGRLGILSPEGGIFDLLAGRYSDGLPNLDAFLKAHAGDQLRVDRIGRPAEHLREPALTVGLAVQPAVIEGLADRPGFRGRGLLARFLYSMPRSIVGRRRVDPPPVPAEVTAAYGATVRALLDLPADRGEDGEIVSRDLAFTPEAVQALLRFSADLEPRLAEGGDLEPVRDWAAKLPGAVARVAAILHLADLEDPFTGGLGPLEPVPEGISDHSDLQTINPDLATFPSQNGISDQCDHSDQPPAVPGEAVERAAVFGRYLIPHALAAFGLMGTNSENEHARFLLRWILKGKWKRFTKREAWLGTRGRFKRADEIDLPLQELEARGYIRRDSDEQRTGRGRRPSSSYSVNPLTCDQSAHNDQNSAGGGPEGDSSLDSVVPRDATQPAPGHPFNDQNDQNCPGRGDGPVTPPSQDAPAGANLPVPTPGTPCRHCGARDGQPHFRGEESACPLVGGQPSDPASSGPAASDPDASATPGHSPSCDCASCVPPPPTGSPLPGRR